MDFLVSPFIDKHSTTIRAILLTSIISFWVYFQMISYSRTTNWTLHMIGLGLVLSFLFSGLAMFTRSKRKVETLLMIGPFLWLSFLLFCLDQAIPNFSKTAIGFEITTIIHTIQFLYFTIGVEDVTCDQ